MNPNRRDQGKNQRRMLLF